MRCYICDGELSSGERFEEDQICYSCWYLIEEAIDRDNIEENNDRPV